MKIIITESQIKSLKESLLLESNDDVLTYTTKYYQKLYGWDNRLGTMNYLAWQNVPAGTKFKMVIKNGYANIQAWNGALVFNCGVNKIYTKNDTFKGEALINALKNKFCSGKNYKKELVNAYYDKEIEVDLNKVEDQNCISKIKLPYKNAINWWKNKLNEQSFFSKLKKLNNYTDQQTKDWISKYKNYLSNNISGPFCPTKNSKWYKENIGVTKFIAQNEGRVGANRIVYNTDYQNDSPSNIEATIVHEIQHALYDLKPMTPHESWKKVFPYKVWVSQPEDGRSSQTIGTQEKSTIAKYGIETSDIEFWKIELLLKTDPKLRKDPNYVCRETELASRVVAIKKLLNYKTDQKITPQDFKKFITRESFPYNDENAYWLVLCWVNNGMEDIQTFLDKLDKYVVAKVEPKKGDDMKDQIT